jgi:TPR repeat protein
MLVDSEIQDQAADVRPDGVSSGAEALFQLGLAHSIGAETEEERVAAHKWFGLAALRGKSEAAAHRQQIALVMTPKEIVRAQRAARQWLTLH